MLKYDCKLNFVTGICASTYPSDQCYFPGTRLFRYICGLGVGCQTLTNSVTCNSRYIFDNYAGGRTDYVNEH